MNNYENSYMPWDPHYNSGYGIGYDIDYGFDSDFL